MSLFSRAFTVTRILCFLMVVSPSAWVLGQQPSMQLVIEQYRQQYFELALDLLVTIDPSEPDYAYYHGLIHYQLFNFEQALPSLLQANQVRPNDAALLQALTDVYRADQQWSAAAGYAQRLVDVGEHQQGFFLLGKIERGRNNHAAALTHFIHAAEGENTRIAQQAALAAAEIHYRNENSDLARAIILEGISLNPDSFDAYSLRQLHQNVPLQETQKLHVSLGYRLEYDDNVALVPSIGQLPGSPVIISDESDVRHVLTADVTYHQPLGNGLVAFGEAHLAHNRQFELSLFDQTSINLVAGIGGSWNGLGWRLPVEYDLQRFDGSRFLTTWSVLPGIYYKPSDDWMLHLFARLGEIDDHQVISPIEDQGGNLSRLGIFVYGRLTDDLSLRGIVEAGDNNADGLNWQRNEARVYAYLEYAFNSRWTAGAGVQYQRLDFDNVNDVFQVRRDDDINEAFVSVAYQLDRHWELRAQASRVQQDSTIDVLSYNRNVFSLGLTWEY